MVRFGQIHYNNWIAKTFLFGSFNTIMLYGQILTKEDFLTSESENHERIHVDQFIDCLIIGLILAVIFIVLFPAGWIWFILAGISFYYILYLLEYIVSFIHHFFSTKKKNVEIANDKAYYASAMEMEAYENQNNLLYRKTRKRFSHFKYYGKL